MTVHGHDPEGSGSQSPEPSCLAREGAPPLACGSPRSIWGTGMYKGLDYNRIKEGLVGARP
jgi:hypothetical protein